MNDRAIRNVVVLLFLVVLACPLAAQAKAKKVLILGIDGMDPRLLDTFLEEGLMPNFERLIAQGDYKPLQTSIPPQSPVAWSTFITGMDAGGHGIFDFVHRDPSKTFAPYLSMSQAIPAEKTIGVGSWVIPLSQGRVENLRQGKAFWQLLEEHGVPTTIFRIPANFPPTLSPGKSFSGMGTPDIQGTPGTFFFYTDDLPDNPEERWSGARYESEVAADGKAFSFVQLPGGKVFEVQVLDHQIDAFLVGPKNTFRRIPKKASGFSASKKKTEYEEPRCTADFSVFVDPDHPVAKFVVQDDEFVLQQGEWSDWIRIDFEMVPYLAGVSAIGRFYLQQVRPEFKLYVTPLQINPEEPAMPMSTPEDWSHELYQALGYFYTQELPEDTKALSNGVFSGREFWEQAQFVYRERRRALDYFLDQFDEGLLFFYFSSLDQGCHMLWRYVDKDHPGHDPTEELVGSIGIIYQEMDEALGRVLEKIDEDTVLIVMSDHGFSPFYWGVNLNSWLAEKGYVKLKDPSRQGQYKYYMNVDWSRTKAYALGLNGLYINRRGREVNGIVAPEEYDALLDQLEQDLLAMRDPRNGRQPITLVTKTHREFHGDQVEIGPDIIVGFNWGYRSSWESPLGEFPKEIFVDNDEAWSGDHCVDYRVTPGVLLTNQKITLEAPALYDLTVAVLDEYGVPPLEEMIGRDCLAAPGAQVAAGSPVKDKERLDAVGYLP